MTRAPWISGLLILIIGLAPVALAQQQQEAEEKRPQVWAVLIGIDRYEEPLQIPGGRGSVRDASAFGQFLAHNAGWGADHVLLLTDAEPPALPGLAGPKPERRRPTRAELDRAFQQWLPQRVRPGDVILVYFAGQAVSLPTKPDARPGDPPRDYLLPVDARSADLDGTGWSLGEAIDDLAAKGENPIVCLLDTSPLGRVRPVPRPEGDQPVPEGDRLLKGIVRWPGVSAWLAASDQPAAENRDGVGLLYFKLLPALGDSRKPRNLLASLDRLRRDAELASQGFRTLGGVSPDLSLWPADRRQARSTKDRPLLQRGHADRVTAVTFTADGSRMATASKDSTIRLWKVEDGTLLRVLPGHLNGVTLLALSPDGRLLASGDGMGSLRFWDLSSGLEKPRPGARPHTNDLVGIAFLPDGDRVVSIDSTGFWRLWDVTGPTVQLVPRPPNEPRGRLLSAASVPGPVAFALAVADPAGGAESMQLRDTFGAVVHTLPGPATTIERLDLSDDGQRLAIGTQDGRVIVRDVATGRDVWQHQFPGPISALVSSTKALAIGSKQGLHLVRLDREGNGNGNGNGPVFDLPLLGSIGQVQFSADGRRLAACSTVAGTLKVWEIPDDAEPRILPLDASEEVEALSLAFAPGGDSLAVGEGSGGLRTWQVPSGAARPAIPAHRGQLAHLAVSDDGRYLLQVTRDGVAQVWNLEDGRGPRAVSGRFRPSGAFLPKGAGLVLVDARGDLTVFDPSGRTRRSITFERPNAEGRNVPISSPFEPLVIAPDGRWIASGSPRSPLVCLWNVETGQLVGEPIRGHDDGITDLEFSADGRMLLTASEDGRALLWDLQGNRDQPLHELPHANPEAFDAPSPITAATLSRTPGTVQVAIGRQDGRLDLWDVSGSRVLPLTRIDGAVQSVLFTPDGRYLAASGDDTQLVLRDLEDPGRPVTLNPRPHHNERINALVSWPDGSLLASASADTTINLWRLADRTLLGTFSADQDSAAWIVYTPDGLYDGSADGERQVTWQRDDEVGGMLADDGLARLEQFFGHSQFGLAADLRAGERPESPPRLAEPPPQLVIEPILPPDPRQRTVELSLALGGEDLSDLRIYHNGVAVRGDLAADGRRIKTRLALTSGTNRIYAMAGRAGAIDGRSNVLDLAYEGPTPGRLHVLSLGVSDYKVRSLQFAHQDAEAIAEFLHGNGLYESGAQAEPIVLLNDRVDVPRVDEAFSEIRRRVRDRPEDAIVVFLAGHTDIRRGQFCLLLPQADLPDGPLLVASRSGNAGRPSLQPVSHDPNVLPYVEIHRNLSHLDALQRLVIVDACQAEAIFDDRTIRRRVDRESRMANTSYLLAARRGELANEVEALEHGLLTYVLLRGMGADGLRPVEGLSVFQEHPDADFDDDGRVTTEELRRYADLALPPLTARYPDLVRRGAQPENVPLASTVRTQDAVGEAFPLVEILRQSGAGE
ncbi:hypothetical protein BH23PLA1_BH23PLA1_03500 [soil metagenome]